MRADVGPDAAAAVEPVGELGARRPLVAILVSLRPRQWVKNLFVFAGLIFGHKLFTGAAAVALLAFVIFCALSGVVYIVNDIVDREKDRLHPLKRQRPIAAGQLSVRTATVAAASLFLLSLGASVLRLPLAFTLAAIAYTALLLAYSFWLKHVVIVDVLVVAAGFVLRAVAGALAIDVEISGWLLICTILMALFLALGKRRHEYLTLDDAARHRPILAEYSPGLLDQMIAVVTASTVTAYALYTMSPETVAKFHTHLLPATLPFVLYGIFRYLYLLYRHQLGGNPSELFLNDRALLLNALAWMVAVVVIIYGPALL